jgi:hypothetical protein
VGLQPFPRSTAPPLVSHTSIARGRDGDIAHSPSGSHAAAAAASGGDEAFADTAAEDGGDSKLSALLYGTAPSAPKP